MRLLRHVIVPILVVFILPFSLATVQALPPTGFRSIEPSEFEPVAIPPQAIIETLPPPSPIPTLNPPTASPTPTPKPTPREAAPTAKIKVEVKPTKTKSPAVRIGARKVSGLGTWYCKAGRSVCHRSYPDRSGVADFYAAAGSEIRIGSWRGRTVTVCRTDGAKCISVKLVDWCACKGNRIIDLYWDAFNALNVKGETGGVRVTVSW